ncbi:hypothetical protein FB45DRAFT_1039666 [Roridomyces roridus]|uniref:Uncharacterized protein n=1 Tax=Roridomyces roridus TaxID=1738132 RepID=A0AAD7FB30_9AGAR|nr:hypothetical protein FB45DRAFT_1039666 [Roridomyces roridus]
MFPPELVELIVRYGWECLSTSSHRHAYSMTSWMLVSREWLSIVIPIFLRDVWATSHSLMIMLHLFASCRSPGLADQLAGVPNRRTGEYERQCTELAEYAAKTRDSLEPPWPWGSQRQPYYGIPLQKLKNVVLDWVPNVTALHFVLVDCLPTYWYWNVDNDVHDDVLEIRRLWSLTPLKWDCITDLHFTFAYTSPPSPLLVSAPRGTFYPPRSESDLPMRFPKLNDVKRLVVREANADFIAFLATELPRLECIESTAAFGADDLPPEVAERVGDRMVFKQLEPTAEWDIVGSDLNVRPKEDSLPAPEKKKKSSLWSIVKRAFRKRK